jgi:hypothetical protein
MFMSVKTQQKNMQTIYSLISMDLGYIYGERESGPNGAKKEFLSRSAVFLRALGKELNFKEMKVTTNPSGIAVSGDVTLHGIWGEGNGLYFKIEEPVKPFAAFLYRHTTSMKDYSSGHNQWLACSVFEDGDYGKLIKTLSELRKPMETEVRRHAA